MTNTPTKYIFIDESGDPSFYGSGKRLLVGTVGFQPYLIIGMIETPNRKKLRKKVVEFMDSIKSDVLYNTIPSLNSKKEWYVHARADHPEVRIKFFELLRQLPDYKAHIVIARKDLSIFNRKHNNNPSEFYFDVLHHLLKNKMIDCDTNYKLYLSQRGNNSMNMFNEAVTKALNSDVINLGKNQKINCSLKIVSNEDVPELSIIDYLMWALQRKLLKGEDRYFDALKEKYGTILELYGEQ
jgi:hypothetical protein